MLALLDLDSYLYRVCYAGEEDSLSEKEKALDNLVLNIKEELEEIFKKDILIISYVSGNDNFRYDVSTRVGYKSARKKEKPKHFYELYKYALYYLGAVQATGEADDLVSINAWAMLKKDSDAFVVVSIDKDLDQIPGHHYNTIDKTLYYITPEMGNLNFYAQAIAGDSVDTIPGIFRVGMKTAMKILNGATTEEDMCVRALSTWVGYYRKLLPDNDALALYMGHRNLIETARLVYMKKDHGDVWCPPEKSQIPMNIEELCIAPNLNTSELWISLTGK
jgi:5'-3' exonuclease